MITLKFLTHLNRYNMKTEEFITSINFRLFTFDTFLIDNTSRPILPVRISVLKISSFIIFNTTWNLWRKRNWNQYYHDFLNAKEKQRDPYGEKMYQILWRVYKFIFHWLWGKINNWILEPLVKTSKYFLVQ